MVRGHNHWPPPPPLPFRRADQHRLLQKTSDRSLMTCCEPQTPASLHCTANSKAWPEIEQTALLPPPSRTAHVVVNLSLSLSVKLGDQAVCKILFFPRTGVCANLRPEWLAQQALSLEQCLLNHEARQYKGFRYLRCRIQQRHIMSCTLGSGGFFGCLSQEWQQQWPDQPCQ